MDCRLSADILDRFHEEIAGTGAPSGMGVPLEQEGLSSPTHSLDAALTDLHLSPFPALVIGVGGETERRILPRVMEVLGIELDPNWIRIVEYGGTTKAKLRLGLGVEVNRKRIERLMRQARIQGIYRRRGRKNLVNAATEEDLDKRTFTAAWPDALWLTDITEHPTGEGKLYCAAVMAVFSRRIIGWSIRRPAGHRTGHQCPVHGGRAAAAGERKNGAAFRSRCGQYTSIHFTETLMLTGLRPSIGTVGDAFDNALAETTIGLYKTECVRDGSPFRKGPLITLADLEEITAAWVHWYNTSRLMHRLGLKPPAEAEDEHHQQRADPTRGQAHK